MATTYKLADGTGPPPARAGWFPRRWRAVAMLMVGVVPALAVDAVLAQDAPVVDDPGMQVVRKLTLNIKGDGYRGIWHRIRPTSGVGLPKYSGGLGTYPAKHQDYAVYCPEVNKTFFCFGGAAPDNDIHLLHMVSYYDHTTATVPRPTVLLDKKTSDPHDNPVICVDASGHLWIFSPSHGKNRPSYIHRSAQPWSIDEFEIVVPCREIGARERFISNFSYVQAFYGPAAGFSCFFTRYHDLSDRTSYFMASDDGRRWFHWRPLAAIEKGHYQVSAYGPGKVATMMNYHPTESGIDGRTNLYYLESRDRGTTWQTADGAPVDTPLTKPHNAALVHDYKAENKLVYLKDLVLDKEGAPVLLHLTSDSPSPTSDEGPHEWRIAQHKEGQWRFSAVTHSDHNYDYGFLELGDDAWTLTATTDPGPFPQYAGGEVVRWVSHDEGESWRRGATLTANSRGNHTYPRRVRNAHDDFCALWADSDPTKISSSRLYFCNARGEVFQLPDSMSAQTAHPQRIEGPSQPVAAVR